MQLPDHMASSLSQTINKEWEKLLSNAMTRHIPLMTASFDLSDDLHSNLIPSPLFEVSGIHCRHGKTNLKGG